MWISRKKLELQWLVLTSVKKSVPGFVCHLSGLLVLCHFHQVGQSSLTTLRQPTDSQCLILIVAEHNFLWCLRNEVFLHKTQTDWTQSELISCGISVSRPISTQASCSKHSQIWKDMSSTLNSQMHKCGWWETYQCRIIVVNAKVLQFFPSLVVFQHQ